MTCAKILSWNVNGCSNVQKTPQALAFAINHDVICLQETFEVGIPRLFRPNGYLCNYLAAKTTGGRPSGGLLCLINLSKFPGLQILNVQTPESWILATEWWGNEIGRNLLLNVYLPRHSQGFSTGSIASLRRFVLDCRSRFPTHQLVLCGDWNADFHRPRQSPLEKAICIFLNEVQSWGFTRFPSDRTPTYADNNSASTIDYFLCPESVGAFGLVVGSQRTCQHFPLSLIIPLPERRTVIAPSELFDE